MTADGRKSWAPCTVRLASLLGCLIGVSCGATHAPGSSTTGGTGSTVGPNGGASAGVGANAGAGQPGTGAVSSGGAVNAMGGASGASASAGQSTSAGAGATAGAPPVVGPGTYALKPPNQCYNRFAVQGCKKGDPSSECGGACTNDYGATSANACEGGKTGVAINFACPRFLLYSDEFVQAATDDTLPAFNYGIVGHDVDKGGVDGTNNDACCQCYQIVFDYPKENQIWQDPNASASPVSAVPPPKAMIVQAFNTGTAGPGNFDIYMGAGGLGANNGCFSIGGSSSPSGLYQYTGYPAAGQPGGGGVKAAGEFGNQSACKTDQSWVSAATLASAGCVSKVTTACNEIVATDPAQQAAARRSCIQSNAAESFYHANWYFWAKRVECPTHLTEVTGCKLAPQGLPAPDSSVTTVAQAQAAGFRQKDNTGQQYFTTTMEDCCKPSCAWTDNVKAVPTVGKYNSFYSCNQAGIPQTEP